MRIAICDDDKQEREQLIEALHGWDPTRQAECFSDGASFLEAAGTTPPFSIAFLDIYMPGENGMDIAKQLQTISPETGIVFVTTSKEHAIDAFSLHALHYLVKPVTTEGVVEAFRRLTRIHSAVQKSITLTIGRESRTIYLDEICYLQSSNHAIEIFLKDGRNIKVWMSLGEMEEKLSDSFLKLNRGTIVNMDYIEIMGTDICVLRDGTRLEITRQKRAAIRTVYNNYLFSCLSKRQNFESEVK